MNEHTFGVHTGHLTARADQIAQRHGATHVNFTEPCGQRRGWFCCRNRGTPWDEAIEHAVWADIEKAGGLDALRHKRDREENV